MQTYSYTGEYSGDYNELLYLRARFYAPGMGRFLTRDMWAGDYNRPLSLNRWMYGYGNPVNYTDPTGHCSWTENNRIETAKKYVLPQPNSWMTTYVAAGIAVQCWGTPADAAKDPGYYNGRGISQTSIAMTEIEYGKKIEDPGVKIYVLGIGIWWREPSIRGYGERCYISLSGESCECFTPDEIAETADFDKKYQLEPPHDPTNEFWSVEYMRRRIQMAVDACKDNFCKDRDKFIVAALAQNGPGFTIDNIKDLKSHLIDHEIQWKDWYSGLSADSKKEYREQWNLFYRYAQRLNNDGYYLPPDILNDEMILWLKNQ